MGHIVINHTGSIVTMTDGDNVRHFGAALRTRPPAAINADRILATLDPNVRTDGGDEPIVIDILAAGEPWPCRSAAA